MSFDPNNDDPAASSNLSEPPAGDNSSGRSYLDILAGFVGNFASGSRVGPGKNDNERWNHEDNGGWRNNERRNNNGGWSNSQMLWSDNERRNDNYRGRYEGYSWDTRAPRYHPSKDDLRDIALGTLQILDEGEYFPPGQDGSYDLRMKIRWTDENTRYYGPDAGEGGELLESEFIKINEEGGDEREDGKQEEWDKDGNTSAGAETNVASSLCEPKQREKEKAAPTASENTPIFVGEYSTLVGARRVHLALATNPDSLASKKIGVLNFASAKKPGGGFINGSQAQEESIARSSTLYPSLITDAASQFYSHYPKDPNNAYYTHAMVYSPAVVLFRDDEGEWRSPVEVDVLTSAAVNAGEIRRELEREERVRREHVEAEIWKKRAEERRKAAEKAGVERRKLIAEKHKAIQERAKLRKEKEEVARPKKERVQSAKLQKKMVKSRNGNETTQTDEVTRKGKTKGSDGEKEETSVEQEKADTEVEIKKGKGKEAKVEKPEENQEANATNSPESGSSSVKENKESEGTLVQNENETDSPESGSSSDSPLKELEEDKESKGSLVQDDQLQPPQPEALPEVSQEAAFSSTIHHRLLSRTQPSQAYLLAVSNAEMQIYQTMYARISRILHLFQLHQIPRLILGSFGTGVFQNRIDDIANIFADLLVKPGGRFKNVFGTVVFAILGKETVRVFTEVFSKVDKQAQKERKCKSCVFKDGDWGDTDVRETEDEWNIRMMKWDARRNVLWNAAQDAANVATAQDNVVACLDGSDEALYSPTFEAADATPYPAWTDTGFHSPFDVPEAIPHAAAHPDVAAHAASFDTAHYAGRYTPSLDVPQATAAPRATSFAIQADPTSFGAVQPCAASYPPSIRYHDGAVPYPTTYADNQASLAPARAGAAIFSVQDNHDNYGVLEDEKMMLTRSDGQVDVMAEETDNASTTLKAMNVDEGKDIEMMDSEIKSFSACSREARSSGDGDIEMQ